MVVAGFGGASASTASADALFTVVACASGAPNHSWFEFRSAPSSHLPARTLCREGEPDPYGDMAFGIGVFDELWPAEAPPGGDLSGSSGLFAELRFTAPPRSHIRTAELRRDVGHRYDAWTSYGQVDGVDQSTESCQPSVDEILCRRTGTKRFDELAARTIAYGVRCSTDRSECDVGATVHRVWALVLEARVTLEDLEAPVVSAVELAGLADGRWHRGGGFVVFSASDNTGVRERRVLSDRGALLGIAKAPSAASGGCFDGTGVAYTYTEPCAGSRGINGPQSVSVSDPCALGDGVHWVRGVAIDTGGRRSETAPASVRIDCSAPVVSVTAGATTRAAGSSLEPAVHAADAASGLASTTVEVSEDAGLWQRLTGPLEVADGQAYRFRARATDVAGNVSGWTYSAVVTGEPAASGDDGSGGTTDGDGGSGGDGNGLGDGYVGDGNAGLGTTGPDPSGPSLPAPLPAADPASRAVSVLPSSPPVDALRRPPLDPALRILRAKVSRRSVAVSGSIALSYDGVVTVRVSARGRSIVKRSAVRRGRWSVRLRRPASGPLRVAVMSPATGRHRPAGRIRALG